MNFKPIMAKIFHKENGLTLIEILLSLAILAILASTSFFWFLNYYQKAELGSSAKSAINVLRKARTNSISGKDSKNWGVYFDDTNNRLILFRDEGSGYGDGSGIVIKEENYLSSLIIISSVSLNGGGKEVIFDSPRGETLQYGTIEIKDPKNNSSQNITVTQIGLIEGQ